MMRQRAEPGTSPVLARLLAAVILALMTAAAAYSGWIAVANWHRIGV